MKNNTETILLKTCEFCNAPLPIDCKEKLCTNCKERILFLSVKDFIRAYDVNEFQVAEHFGIPLRIVKNWIKEGRIEYKEDTNGKHIIANIHCKGCGAPITFGTLCSKCLKKSNRNIEGHSTSKPAENERMRFLKEHEE